MAKFKNWLFRMILPKGSNAYYNMFPKEATEKEREVLNDNLEFINKWREERQTIFPTNHKEQRLILDTLNTDEARLLHVESLINILSINTELSKEEYNDITTKDIKKALKIYQLWRRYYFKKIEISSMRNKTKMEQCNSIPLHPKYPGIAKALGKYIRGASDYDIETIIATKSLPSGATKKEWLGNPADAHRFIEHFELSVSKWNKCFEPNEFKKLHQNQKTKPKFKDDSGMSDIINIINGFPL